LLIAVGGGLILVPGMPLVRVSYISQVANGFLLPFVLVFMLQLSNRSDLMGAYTISKGYNIVAISTVVFLVILTVVLIGLQLAGQG
jgi:Mn2+/Fe2+ NRAMP family transporter